MKKRQRNINIIGSLLFLVWVLAACSPAIPAPTAAATIAAAPSAIPALQPTATQSVPSILPALANANFPIDVTSTGTAQLKDGVFEEPAAPGSASKITVTLGKNPAEGDLNGDGVPDAAVTLNAETGGSGTFTYLAAVINKNGIAEPLNAVLIGDRIVVKNLTIKSGQIDLEFLDHSANEPLAAAPTVDIVKKFKLQQDQLVEVK